MFLSCRHFSPFFYYFFVNLFCSACCLVFCFCFVALKFPSLVVARCFGFLARFFLFFFFPLSFFSRICVAAPWVRMKSAGARSFGWQAPRSSCLEFTTVEDSHSPQPYHLLRLNRKYTSFSLPLYYIIYLTALNFIQSTLTEVHMVERVHGSRDIWNSLTSFSLCVWFLGRSERRVERLVNMRYIWIGLTYFLVCVFRNVWGYRGESGDRYLNEFDVPIF